MGISSPLRIISKNLVKRVGSNMISLHLPETSRIFSKFWIVLYGGVERGWVTELLLTSYSLWNNVRAWWVTKNPLVVFFFMRLTYLGIFSLNWVDVQKKRLSKWDPFFLLCKRSLNYKLFLLTKKWFCIAKNDERKKSFILWCTPCGGWMSREGK